MPIVGVRRKPVRLESKLRNATFSFDEMTTSIVAEVTGVYLAVCPVVGYAFNYTGRCACRAQISYRLVLRLMKVPKADAITINPAQFDPERVLSAMMVRAKSAATG